MLFKPFKLKIWLVLAFTLAMTLIGEGITPSAGFTFQIAVQSLHGITLDQTLHWIQAHTAGIILSLIGAVLVLFPLYLLCRWIASRGHFILLDNIKCTTRKTSREPWHEFRELGNSLLKFRISWDLLIFNIYLVLFIIAGALEWPDFKAYLMTDIFKPSGWTTAAIIFFLMEVAAVSGIFLFFTASNLVFRMMIPVMYIRRINAWPAFKLTWRELFRPNPGKCILYFLFSIVIALIGGMVANIGMLVLAVYFTLCIALPVMLYIPIVGNYPIALAGLPVGIFDAAYQLHFISQFGPEYAVNWHVPVSGGFPVILNAPETPPLPDASPLTRDNSPRARYVASSNPTVQFLPESQHALSNTFPSFRSRRLSHHRRLRRFRQFAGTLLRDQGRGLLYITGSSSDNGWTQLADTSLAAVAKDQKIEFLPRQDVKKDNAADAIRQFESKGYSLIILHGYEYLDVAKELTDPSKPGAVKIRLAVSGGAMRHYSPNFQSLLYDLGPASYQARRHRRQSLQDRKNRLHRRRSLPHRHRDAARL